MKMRTKISYQGTNVDLHFTFYLYLFIFIKMQVLGCPKYQGKKVEKQACVFKIRIDAMFRPSGFH